MKTICLFIAILISTFQISAQPYFVTFYLDMNDVEFGFTTPEINGTFNDWCGGCAPLTDSNGDGVWQITLLLDTGSYQYKFAYDNWTGQETIDPTSICSVITAGNTYRLINVSEEMFLQPICWESCYACGAVTPVHTVTFQLDMNTVSQTFTHPEISGSFNNWCDGCTPMEDINLDGIWSKTLELEEGFYEYFFTYNNGTVHETLIPNNGCTITTDIETHRLLGAISNQLLAPVCWQSCIHCSNFPPSFNVTFSVDMNNVTESFTTPQLSGTFNNWCNGCQPMTDIDQDGIWETTRWLQSGVHKYKFTYDSWAGEETLDDGSSCTVTNLGVISRYLFVNGEAVLPAVCWSECTSCDELAVPQSVTFSVNMNDVTQSFTTPEVNGTFNNWCGGCNPMSDSDGDNIWELTIDIPEGSHLYRFAADNFGLQENIPQGSSCTVTNDNSTNRALTVSQAVNLSVACWSSCELCAIGVTDIQSDFKMNLYPNPVANQLIVEFDHALPQAATLTIIDLSGHMILNTLINTRSLVSIDTSGFADGMYIVQILSNKTSSSQRFVVRN